LCDDQKFANRGKCNNTQKMMQNIIIFGNVRDT